MTEGFKEEVRELESSNERIGGSRAQQSREPSTGKGKEALSVEAGGDRARLWRLPSRLAAPGSHSAPCLPKRGQGLGLGRSLGKGF